MPDLPGGSSAAHAVPDHVDDDRRPVILEHDDLHPVVEREARDLGRREGQGRDDGQGDGREKALHGWRPSFPVDEADTGGRRLIKPRHATVTGRQ
jgi:hypothetical protein